MRLWVHHHGSGELCSNGSKSPLGLATQDIDVNCYNGPDERGRGYRFCGRRENGSGLSSQQDEVWMGVGGEPRKPTECRVESDPFIRSVIILRAPP